MQYFTNLDKLKKTDNSDSLINDELLEEFNKHNSNY